MQSRRELFQLAFGAGASSPAPSRPVDDDTRVLVDQFTEVGAADEAPGIRRAIAEAIKSGRVVAFSGREYRIGSTIDLPTGIHLVGTGAVVGPRGPNSTAGTILRRVRDGVMLRAQGSSFRIGGPMRHSIVLRDIQFYGSDYASDLVQFIAASRIYIENCMFGGSKGRNLLLWEVFDSRINNTDFEWGGTAGTGIPMIELRSGGSMEYTNHVHFLGCRCESYPGTAIALTGNNTNKIYFTNCKLESGESNDPALVLDKVVVAHFSGLQITGRGTPGQRLDGFIKARDCYGIIGDVVLEYNAEGGKGAQLASYLDLGNVQAVDLTLHVIDNLRPVPLKDYVIFDGTKSSGVMVRGFVRQLEGSGIMEWKT